MAGQMAKKKRMLLTRTLGVSTTTPVRIAVEEVVDEEESVQGGEPPERARRAVEGPVRVCGQFDEDAKFPAGRTHRVGVVIELEPVVFDTDY